MSKLLPQSFYQSKNCLDIAKKLLGKKLVVKSSQGICSGIIVETEAYMSPEDKASHAYFNKRTARTEIMFAAGGHCYVYLCYGIHQMLNVVTGPKDLAHAVLIRAVKPYENIALIAQRRKLKEADVNISNGPGKLTKALHVNSHHNTLKLYDINASIQIYDVDLKISESQILAGPRVGIAYAEECANWPFRFTIKDHKYVSKPAIVKY